MESADAQLNVCGLKLRVPQACIYGCQQLIFPDIICPHVTPEPFPLYYCMERHACNHIFRVIIECMHEMGAGCKLTLCNYM